MPSIVNDLGIKGLVCLLKGGVVTINVVAEAKQRLHLHLWLWLPVFNVYFLLEIKPNSSELVNTGYDELEDEATLNQNQRNASKKSLLCDPNPNSPANSEAARMFSENKHERNRRVKEIVEQSWTAD
ncbi:uncharacterized protein LOC120291715 [Eucalyptus grandis]|uniref:uncharacterized protein LOC120291715 n=1 Tax=Eucalyptus grandis TaxID=71139 RepID=UPI00192EDB73|nr:uncharacterized protein LOC120291715 [Eucalyptus grandis]